jgi:hypothetical protein
VLVVTSSDERAETMRALISRTPALSGSPLFLFADHETLMEADILGNAWTAANGKRTALI